MADDVNIVIGAQDKASRVLDNVASKVGTFGGSFATLGPLAAGVGSALAGVAAQAAIMSAAFEGIVSAANKIDALSDTARGLGASVGELQAFQFAMEEAGNVDADKSVQALQKVQKTIGEIASGGNAAGSKVFEQLNLDAKQLSMKGPIDQFLAVKQAIGGIENVAERASVAQALLGRGAADLVPALIAEQDAFEASMKAASDLGAVVSDQGAESIASMNDAIGRVQLGIEGVYTQTAVALAPAVQMVASTLETWLPPIITITEQAVPKMVDELAKATGYAYDFGRAIVAITEGDSVGIALATTSAASGASAAKFLKALNDQRAEAEKQSIEAEQKRMAMLNANLKLQDDSAQKQADEAAKAIQQLERKLEVATLGEDVVRKQEELALATNDAEREKIRLLQEQIDKQEAFNNMKKENQKLIEEENKAREKEATKAMEDAAKKQAALSSPAPGLQATESRLLTRGRSEQGIDRVAKNTEEANRLLSQIDKNLTNFTQEQIVLETVA